MKVRQDNQIPWRIIPLVIIIGAVLLPLLLLLVIIMLIKVCVTSMVVHSAAWWFWSRKGHDVLFVCSNSPVWKEYLEREILPAIEERAVILNWSERNR